jgi:hypothetical protein
MASRGFAAVLVIAVALVTLIASGGAGAQSGDENQCVGGETTGSTAGVQMCTISESPGKCIQKSSSPVIFQKCIVTQTEDENEVIVDQLNTSSEQGASTQDAQQIAVVDQQGETNRADVSQEIRQTTHNSAGGIQNQDGHQSTVICQGGGPCAVPNPFTNAGTNTANVKQSRWADAHASGGTAAVTQRQDTVGFNPTNELEDCDAVRPPAEPDLCVLVTQNSTTRNDATLNQEDHLLAEANGTGLITQTQGSGDGGIDGHADQVPSTAQNTENAHQHLTYDLSGPKTADQTQDPRIGGGSGGNLNLHQVGILRASGDDAFQDLGIDGICEVTAESCLVLQHGRVNFDNFTTRCDEPGCSANIQCTSSGEGGGCFGFPPKGNPPEEDLTSLGFDTLDFQNAINFTFPVSLPGL